MQIEIGQVWVSKKTGKRVEITYLTRSYDGERLIDLEYRRFDNKKKAYIFPRYLLKNYTLEVQHEEGR